MSTFGWAYSLQGSFEYDLVSYTLILSYIFSILVHRSDSYVVGMFHPHLVAFPIHLKLTSGTGRRVDLLQQFYHSDNILVSSYVMSTQSLLSGKAVKVLPVLFELLHILF